MELTVDQALEQGVAAHKEGKLEEAERLYRAILQSQPLHPDANHNLGVLAVSVNKADAALPLFKTALKANPKIERFWLSYIDALIKEGQFGNAKRLLKQGKKQGLKGGKLTALESTLSSKTKNVNSARPSQQQVSKLLEYYQAGRYFDAEKLAISLTEKFSGHKFGWKALVAVLQQTGRISESLVAARRSVELDPQDAESHNNLGNTFKELGRLEDSIEAYIQALKINPDLAEIYSNMAAILTDVEFRKPMPDLPELICKILAKKTLVRPSDIAKAGISLLKFDPVIKGTIRKNSAGELVQSLQEIIVGLSNIPLLLKLMETSLIPDLELEFLFKDIRSAILLNSSSIKNNTEILRFQIALSSQCFANEYLYDQTDFEIGAFEELENLIVNKLTAGKQPASAELACLSSYKALHEYAWIKLVTIPMELQELERRQIIEPEEEKQLRSKMPMLQEINDNVSKKVRKQYEKNPYPRWVNTVLPLGSKSIALITKEIKLRINNPDINKAINPQILIAGCGTGQNSIGNAARFKDCDVLAIDLSLSSLAYAKRKTEELGITNIEYMHADILDLGALNRQFDIIESIGVLHHMDDPITGWRVLTDCLKPGGLMKIGLYSELARQHIVKIREEIELSNIDSSDDAMKSLRNQILCSEGERQKLMTSFQDFYSLSMFRDLLFHVQEHRFTIPKIKDCLAQLGLIFCGFEADKIVQKFKSEYLSQNAVYDLDKWDAFEKKNPKEFSGMYNLWCQKIV